MQTAGILNSWGENPDEYSEVRDRTLQNVEHWRSAANYQRIASEIERLIKE